MSLSIPSPPHPLEGRGVIDCFFSTVFDSPPLSAKIVDFTKRLNGFIGEDDISLTDSKGKIH